MSSPKPSGQSSIQLRVLVVGAGIAGLSAALALKKAGHKIEIFERSEFANEVGAAITLGPNGTRVLQKLGFNFPEARGIDIKYICLYDGVTLDETLVQDVTNLELITGAPHQAIHRVDLHSQLAKLAVADLPGETPATLHLGAKISRIDVDSAKIELQGGSIFTGDLLIGADGLHSAVRAAAVKSARLPIDSGWVIYRFLVPRDVIMRDPVLKAMKKENTRCIFLGTRLTHWLVWYECRGGEVQNLAAFYRGTDQSTCKIEDYHNSTDKNRVLDLFSHYHPNLLALINTAGKILNWHIFDREPLDTFVYGKTLLIGDAAHPMSPFTAQGGNQAIEDAGAILALLSNLPSKDALPSRLQMFDKVRLIRASRIQLGGIIEGPVNHPLLELQAKYEELDERPAELRLSREGMEWDFKYNVFEKCEKVLRESS